MKNDQEEFLRLTWMLEDAKHNEASALANAERRGERKGELRTKKEMARLMRTDGELEDNIKRYTGYSFNDLDGQQ